MREIDFPYQLKSDTWKCDNLAKCMYAQCESQLQFCLPVTYLNLYPVLLICKITFQWKQKHTI